MSRSLALSLVCVLGLPGMLVGSIGCDKKKSPSEEPTRGDAEGDADGNASGAVVEQPGEEPDGGSSIDPSADGGALEYEGSVAVVAGSAPCELDEDCVPQECCHATTCGAASARPDCSATMCTMECKSGSMDCFGGCFCGEDKKCAANIWTASSASPG